MSISASSLTNLSSDGVLSGGKYRVSATSGVTSTLEIGNSGIVRNEANISLTGAGASLRQLDALTSNAGTLEIHAGNVFSTSSDLENSGHIFLDGASTSISIKGNYSQVSGSTVIEGANLRANMVQLNGGSLIGNGRIDGPVTVNANAHLVPSGESGALIIGGDLTVMNGGGVLFTILPFASYPNLVVNGRVAFSGAITVAISSSFEMHAGDSFELISYGAASDFNHIQGLTVTGVGNMVIYRGQAKSDGYYLFFDSAAAVPEPSSVGLMIVGIMVLPFMIRRKTHKANKDINRNPY